MPDVKEARAAGACDVGEEVALAANGPYEPGVDGAVQDLLDLVRVQLVVEDLQLLLQLRSDLLNFIFPFIWAFWRIKIVFEKYFTWHISIR